MNFSSDIVYSRVCFSQHFTHIFPGVPLGALGDNFSEFLGALWPRSGTPWARFGSLWSSWGSLWRSWGGPGLPFGTLLDHLGDLGGFLDAILVSLAHF